MDNKWFAVIDGKEQGKHDQIGAAGMIFSPDSRHVCYEAKDNDNWYLYADDKKEGPYDGIGKKNPFYSIDSAHLAFLAMSDGQWFEVLDGKPGSKYDDIDINSALFTAGSCKLAYIAKKSGKYFVVSGGAEQAKYDYVSTLVASENGKSLAYFAMEKNKYFVVQDGREGEKYTNLTKDMLCINSAGDRVAFGVVDDSKKQAIVVDGHKSRMYEGLVADSAKFSPDGQRFVCGVKNLNSYGVLLDGIEMGKFTLLMSAPVFSPDSKTVAYCAKFSNGSAVIVNGRPGKKYDGVIKNSSLVFDDNDTLHYMALSGSNVYLVKEKVR
jgi:hypothetical protein